MIASQAAAGDTSRGAKASGRQDRISKMAANAFLLKAKETDEDGQEEKGSLLDQRRINEIFVRLKIAELSALYFALLGVMAGIFDYEVSYNDNNDSRKTERLILE